MREPRLSVATADADATTAIGTALALALPADAQGLLMTLAGELGAGKTTLARALLRGLGVTGTVRSPTYTLVEPYELGGRTFLHFDLYRLNGPSDLEALGYRELRAASALSLLEWPERGGAAVGRADVACDIAWRDAGRQLEFTAHSDAGRAWLAALQTDPAMRATDLPAKK